MWAYAVLLVIATEFCHVSSENYWPPRSYWFKKNPYWANISHDGVPLECTERSKFCLSFNQLLHEPSNTCHDLGAREPCTENGGTLVIDEDAFQMGRLRTYCRPLDECEKNGGYTMAYDGKCFTLDYIVQSNLCPNSPKMMQHAFGRWECHRPIFQGHIKFTYEEEENKQCIMPSLRNERYWPWVKCNAHESECLRTKRFPYMGKCYFPLETEPCPEGHFLVYDEAAAKEGNLRVSCAKQRPCGPHALLYREDKSCHSEEELRGMCKEGFLILTPGGEVSCSANNLRLELVGAEKKPGLCEVSFVIYYAAVVTSGVLACGVNNLGNCGKEVAPVKPSIIIESED